MARQRLDVFVGSHALDQIVCGGVAVFQDACKPVLGKAKQTERVLDGKSEMSTPIED